MAFLLKPAFAATALLAASSFAAPLARQYPGDSPFIIQNVELGTVLTLDTSFPSGNGMPIGVSPCIPGAANQSWTLFEWIVNYDTYNYQLWPGEPDTTPRNYMSTVQTTSSDPWAPGYYMMQTYDEPQNFTLNGNMGTGFTLSPTNFPENYVDWYHYDDPSASFIPLIVNAETGETGQEWVLLYECPSA